VATPPYFSLRRPFDPPLDVRPSRYYPYGTTAGGAYLLHHGVDMGNPMGADILAVDAGDVVYAGEDLQGGWGPDPDFYGRLVVLRHAGAPDGGPDPIYSLYGHVSETLVLAGEHVARGQLIARVGAAGIALGPHLHLEIRTAPRNYGATLNPELFLEPLPSSGAIVGRAVTATGDLLRNVAVSLYSVDGPGGSSWVAGTTTYPSTEVNGDPHWRENFLFGDVPAGVYEVGLAGRALRPSEAITVTEGGVADITIVQ
jgi:hypothetical protein